MTWAAEICSAEAAELPVLKRPAVSVANGFCHPIPGAMYWAAEICSAEATELPSIASSARCGKRILPPQMMRYNE